MKTLKVKLPNQFLTQRLFRGLSLPIYTADQELLACRPLHVNGEGTHPQK